jgi:transposase InsO family protein
VQARIAGPRGAGPADRAGVDAEGGRGRPQRRGGDCAQVVASLASSEPGRADLSGVSALAAAGPEIVPVVVERRAGAGDPQSARDDELRADAVAVPHRPASLDDLEGAQASRRRRRATSRQTSRRYEWAEAGALLHIDAFEAPKFAVPGHWATGQRAEQHKTRKAGKSVVVGVIDDHTRLVYCELHAAENAIAVSSTLRRAAVWFREQGCGPVQAVMSDNAKCYSTSFAFRDVLAELGARHILIPPYTPRWNGKIERSSAPSTPNGHTAASGPTAPHATAPCHRSSATTTAADPTQPAAAAPPSPAFTKTASRTPSDARS